MSKYPLLEELRAKRQIEETEIKAPIVNQLNYVSHKNKLLNDELTRIESKVGTELGEYVLRLIGDRLSYSIQAEVINACEKAWGKKKKQKFITIAIDTDTIKFMLPTEINNYVLGKYKQVFSQLHLTATESFNKGEKVVTLGVHIPSLHCQYNMVEDK